MKRSRAVRSLRTVTFLFGAGILFLGIPGHTYAQIDSYDPLDPLLQVSSLSQGEYSGVQGGLNTHLVPRYPTDHIHIHLAASRMVRAAKAAADCSNISYRYSAFRKTLQQNASAPTVREGFGAARGADGLIYYFGGDDCTGNLLSAIEAYNENSNSWSTGYPRDPVARTGVSAAAGEDGLIYVTGGMDATGKVLSLVETYDPHRKAWTTAPSLPIAVMDHASTTGPDGKIYVAGGTDAAGQDTNAFEAFDPGSHSWQSEAPLLEPLSHGGLTEGPDGEIYEVGGVSAGAVLNTMRRYDIATNIWTPALTLDGGRAGAAVVENDLGNIEIIGGADPQSPAEATGEEIDFINGPNAAPHSLIYDLHGPEVAPDEGGLTMDERPFEASGSPVSLKVGGQSWYSRIALNGEFVNPSFLVSIPCGGLGLSLLTTIKLNLTAPDGSAAHQIGSATSLLSACGSGSEMKIAIPTASTIAVQDQLLEVTISSAASLSLSSSAGITLQAVGFNGPEY